MARAEASSQAEERACQAAAAAAAAEGELRDYKVAPFPCCMFSAETRYCAFPWVPTRTSFI